MVAHVMLQVVPERLFTRVIRMERWFQHRLQQAALRKARTRAFHAFAQIHPTWIASLFDEYFLEHEAAPLVERCLHAHDRPTAAEFAAAWCAQIAPRHLGEASFAEVTAVAADFLRLLNLELETYGVVGSPAPAPSIGAPAAPAYVADAEGIFADALRDRSNIEMDWLWLAGQVTRESERRYCLERALYINPRSEQALRMLAQESTEPARELAVGARA
jgi:hypothetical protein